MRRHVLTVPFLAASLLSLTACGASDDETTSTTTPDHPMGGDPNGSDPTINPDDYRKGLVPCEPFDSGFEGMSCAFNRSIPQMASTCTSGPTTTTTQTRSPSS